jgi:hypothetical protein
MSQRRHLKLANKEIHSMLGKVDSHARTEQGQTQEDEVIRSAVRCHWTYAD